MRNIKFKEVTCRNKFGISTEVPGKFIRMYAVINRDCNAHCQFCEFATGNVDIDINKFSETLDKLLKICIVPTIHFTGGEPTLNIEKLKKLLKIIKIKDKRIQTSVNTNGYNLKLLDDMDNLDDIAISRHAITDEENYKIFGCNNISTLKDIQDFKDKYKLHLSCNLIKGHVDNKEKVLEYLELASKLGIFSTGFVSLMDINDYCINHFVDFDNSFNIENIAMHEHQENVIDDKVVCRCENYLYRATNGRIVSAYHRYAIKNKEISDYLVYENDKLRQGFNGEIIGLD